ncbi:MAG: ATP-binding protein involved in chromosome partitioning [Actinomycetota bacterium]|nr:ATP-binding protein involved in chromosome partitioning [Actinomycetota bacterium]
MLRRKAPSQLTEDKIVDALRPVEDPELHVSIVDIGMVKGVAINGDQVGVQIALTVAGCPLRGEITQRVTAALMPLEGVEGVHVDMTVMTPEELQAVRARLGGGNGGGGGHEGHSHGPGGASGHGAGHGNPNREIPLARPDSKTRVLAISSGKGGVGKSSVTVNTAIALQRLGHQVAVLDADVYGFSVPRMLDIDQEPVVIDDMIVPPVAHDVSVISIGFFVGEDQPVIWRGPMLHKALEQFLADVYWGEPDFLLVDMPPGTGDVAISMANYLPRAETYVVTTPQPAAQRVAQRTALMAKKLNLPLFGVIENMSWFTGDDGQRYELFGSGGGQLLATELDVPLVGQIPLVPALREGGDIGTPITVSDPDHEASKAFDAIARHIVANGPKRVYRSELTVH